MYTPNEGILPGIPARNLATKSCGGFTKKRLATGKFAQFDLTPAPHLPSIRTRQLSAEEFDPCRMHLQASFGLR